MGAPTRPTPFLELLLAVFGTWRCTTPNRASAGDHLSDQSPTLINAPAQTHLRFRAGPGPDKRDPRALGHTSLAVTDRYLRDVAPLHVIKRSTPAAETARSGPGRHRPISGDGEGHGRLAQALRSLTTASERVRRGPNPGRRDLRPALTQTLSLVASPPHAHSRGPRASTGSRPGRRAARAPAP